MSDKDTGEHGIIGSRLEDEADVEGHLFKGKNGPDEFGQAKHGTTAKATDEEEADVEGHFFTIRQTGSKGE